MESAKNGKKHPKPAPKPGVGAKAEKKYDFEVCLKGI
jgi:hypothetical protein